MSNTSDAFANIRKRASITPDIRKKLQSTDNSTKDLTIDTILQVIDKYNQLGRDPSYFDSFGVKEITNFSRQSKMHLDYYQSVAKTISGFISDFRSYIRNQINRQSRKTDAYDILDPNPNCVSSNTWVDLYNELGPNVNTSIKNLKKLAENQVKKTTSVENRMENLIKSIPKLDGSALVFNESRDPSKSQTFQDLDLHNIARKSLGNTGSSRV